MMLSAPTPRPALRSSELTDPLEPRPGGSDFGAQRGARIERLSDESSPLSARLTSVPTVDHDGMTATVDRARSSTWMTAITAKVNALWAAFQRSPINDPTPVVMEPESVEPADLYPHQSSSLQDNAPSFDERRLPISSEPTRTRLWHLDSDVAIDLDRSQTERWSPELDLRVPPSIRQKRMVRLQTDQSTPTHGAHG